MDEVEAQGASKDLATTASQHPYTDLAQHFPDSRNEKTKDQYAAGGMRKNQIAIVCLSTHKRRDDDEGGESDLMHTADGILGMMVHPHATLLMVRLPSWEKAADLSGRMDQ